MKQIGIMSETIKAKDYYDHGKRKNAVRISMATRNQICGDPDILGKMIVDWKDGVLIGLDIFRRACVAAIRNIFHC